MFLDISVTTHRNYHSFSFFKKGINSVPLFSVIFRGLVHS